MNDIWTYHLKVSSQADERELNATSPLEMTAEQVDPTATLLAVRTDQSGLIGLMRHVHGLGFTFLSLNREGLALSWRRQKCQPNLSRSGAFSKRAAWLAAP